LKLGGHHDSQNLVLRFFRKRSPLRHSLGFSILWGCDPGGDVMLSQVLIAFLLMAGILAVGTLAIRWHW
jgi:hypothetical protein